MASTTEYTSGEKIMERLQSILPNHRAENNDTKMSCNYNTINIHTILVLCECIVWHKNMINNSNDAFKNGNSEMAILSITANIAPDVNILRQSIQNGTYPLYDNELEILNECFDYIGIQRL
jgi:hypothetical protein